MRIEIQNAVGKMYQFGCVDHLLAGCSRDVHLIVLDPLALHPEGEGAQAARLRKIFRHPGSVRAERLGKILHERSKESVSRFGGGPLENRAQRFVGFKILEWLGAIG